MSTRQLTTYSIIGLLILGVVFVTGNSIAQPMNPFGASLTPSMIEYYKKIAPTGAGGSVGAGYSTPTAGRDVVAASTMISSQLRTPQGDYLAEIRGLVIDPASGHVSDVVLTGIRGMGAKDVVVPFNTVSRTGEAIFIYNAPEEVSQFYSEAPYQRWGFHLYAKQQKEGSYTTSKLIGATVRTPAREDVGRIDDLVIDARDGHIINLAVSHTGATEGKTACVPFSILSQSGENVFVLKTTKQGLKPCAI